MTALLLSVILAQVSPDLDAIALKHFDESGPGVAVLAIKDGRIVLRKGYGLADLESRAAVATNTLFDVASCSKQFTALGILVLVEKRKLKLDDDVRKWLKELKVHDKDRPIRVLDLVHHTSGLTDYLKHLKEAPDPATMGNEEALKLVAEKSLEFRTGKQWAYSNTNYCLLALVIERITKKPFAAFMAHEIFRPLKMKTAVVAEKGAGIKNGATGYVNEGGGFGKPPAGPPTTGDGGIWMSLDDWAAYEAGLSRLLRKESLEQAWRHGRLDNGDPHQYGFGLLVNRSAGTLVGHEGQWAGFRSYFVRRIEDRVTLVLMSNREDMNFQPVTAALMAKLLE